VIKDFLKEAFPPFDTPGQKVKIPAKAYHTGGEIRIFFLFEVAADSSRADFFEAEFLKFILGPKFRRKLLLKRYLTRYYIFGKQKKLTSGNFFEVVPLLFKASDNPDFYLFQGDK